MARYRNPLSRIGTDFEVLMLLAGVGVVGYLVYKAYQGAKAVAGAAVDAGAAVYHGAQAVTAPVSSVIAKALTLYDAPGVGSVPGNILFPDGYAAPASAYTLKTTNPPDGNLYVVDRGSTYQLQPSDADGDWPAVYVSG